MQLSYKLLQDLIKRDVLTTKQLWGTAERLYCYSSEGSQDKRVACELLQELLKRESLTIEQVWKTAEHLYYRYGSTHLQDKRVAYELLQELLKRESLMIEQLWKTIEHLHHTGLLNPQVCDLLQGLLKREDLSIEQLWQTAELLYCYSTKGSYEQRLATSYLFTLCSSSQHQSDVYGILAKMVPQFHQLPTVTIPSLPN